jgi:hypothetical protein
MFENNDQTIDATEEFNRPASITIICVLGFLGAVAAVPLMMSLSLKMISPGYPTLLGVSTVAGLICMIGLWNMKQWAAIMYTGLVIVNQVFLISMGLWSPLALIVPGIIVFIALKNLDKMS